MIRHINPPPKRRSQAPYNFIPLPNAIFRAPNSALDMSGHFDEFLKEAHSGYIDLEISTETPIYVRGPAKKIKNEWDTREVRLRPEPFLDLKNRPVLPGSTLRGAIRNIFEILTFSKIQPVNNDKPFYRSLSRDRLGYAYRSRIVRGGSSPPMPRGGFIEIRADGTRCIRETCLVLRISHCKIRNIIPEFEYGRNATYHPSPDIQKRTVWVTEDTTRSKVESAVVSFAPGMKEAVLVLTGWAPPRAVPGTDHRVEKQYESVFLKACTGSPISIPDTAWQRFHDDDQITPYQKSAFPPKGELRHGDPVFFVCHSDGTLDFFGRAQLFRLPYDKGPANLLPAEHLSTEKCDVDMTEALFGFVPQRPDDKRSAIRGRLEFEDSVGTKAIESLPDMVPKVLSNPKITCYQHYLTQDGARPTRDLTTYLDGDSTTIRGHKLYWHRWSGLENTRAGNQARVLAHPKSSHTRIRPVPENTLFRGRIHFHNLLDFELGALWTALSLPDDHAHKIGMGKSLGFGSIRIEPTLYLLNPRARYSSWIESGYTKCHEAFNRFQICFEDLIKRHAEISGEPISDDRKGLTRFYRLYSLFEMLRLSGAPPPQWTETLPLQGGNTGRSFRTLRQEGMILPTPMNVINPLGTEPIWPNSDRPSPASPLDDDTYTGWQIAAQPGPISKRSGREIRAGIHGTGASANNPEPRTQGLMLCTALEEKTKTGRWLFEISGIPNSKGRVDPRSIPNLPADLEPGMQITMHVTYNNDGSYTLAIPSNR